MKGQQVTVGIVVVIVIFSVLVISFAEELAGGLSKGSRVETVPVVEKRIESVLYTMSAVDRGETTVKLGDDYGLMEDNGDVLVNYTAELTLKPVEEDQRIIDPPVNFSLGEENVSNRFCVSKSESELLLNSGGC
jgi:hypothetical protein